MRNSSEPRVTWGEYVRAARERRRLGQSALARLLGIDRATVYRWEARNARPENADTVQAVAAALGLDVDEALIAAGLKPEGEKPFEPYDDEIAEVMAMDLDLPTKREVIKILVERRERELEARRKDTRRIADLMRRQRELDGERNAGVD